MSALSSGTIIHDRYKLEVELGKGGMGTVYRAKDLTLDREVAIKVLRMDAFGTEGQARLLHEAQVIAKLNHPNIVTVFDVGEWEESPYIIMHLIEGKTLKDHEPSSLEEEIDIARQICSALQHAHENGIIHRDLKPENVLIDKEGTAKLMDFGLARSVTSRVTTEGYITGTVFYMSPEQIMGENPDGRSDLYSFGVMLYELTTGEFPFEDNNPVAIISQHLYAPVVPPRAKNENIPPGLNNLILQLLEKERDDRPASAELVLEALEDPCLLDTESQPDIEVSVLDRIVRGRIVGRKREIEEARAVWQKTKSGQGQTLLISGEPGVGKTRLMHEVIALAEISGGQTYVGECFAESNAPYSAFSQITRKALGRHQNDSLELPQATLADLLKLVPDQVHLYPDIQSTPELDPESEQQRLLEHMVTSCDLLSQLSPLVIIVDDIHWADSSTLAMFQHLARRTKKMPVMLLGTYREVELKEARPFNNLLNELNRQRIGYRIKLNRLTKSQTGEMLATIFQEEISSEFLEGVYRETDGNPFFIEEVCRALVESGKVFYKDGAWDRFDIDKLEIPQGIQVAVESRLSRMDETCQDVMRMAAVLGREFDVEVLQEALGMEENVLIDAVEAAECAHMIQHAEGKGDMTFAFVHALVPQAIRENLRILRKRQMHKRAAAAIEKLDPDNYESMAYHHSHVGNEEMALKYLVLAGERALKAFANRDAEVHFLSALDLIQEDDQEKAHLLTQLGQAQSRLGSNKQAIQTWRKAIDIYLEGQDYDRPAYLYALSGRTISFDGDIPGALSICEEGLKALKDAPESKGMAYLLGEHGRSLLFNRKIPEGLSVCENALKMAEKFEMIDIQAEMLQSIGFWGDYPIEESLELMERAIDLAEGANLWQEASRIHNNVSITMGPGMGDFSAAHSHLRRAVELARQIGATNNECFYLSNVVESNLVYFCDFQDTENVLYRFHSLLESMTDQETGARYLKRRVVDLGFWRDRAIEPAIETSRADLIHYRKVNDTQFFVNASNALAKLLLEIGQNEEGVAILREAVEAAEDVYSVDGKFPKYGLITCLARHGDVKAARQSYDEVVKIYKEGNLKWAIDPMWLSWAEANLLVAEVKWAQAWKAFQNTLELTIRLGVKSFQIITLRDWAEAHLRRGEEEDKQRARELFQETMAICEESGATGWVAYLKKELEKIG